MPFIGVQPASALLTSADIQDGQITTAKVADDAITGAKIENNPTIAGTLNASAGLTTPSGHVIQVITKSVTSDGGTGTQYVIDEAITPTDNNNKILIIGHTNVYNPSGNICVVDLYRGSTFLSRSSISSSGGDNVNNSATPIFLDDPQTTSATSYFVRGVQLSGVGSPKWNYVNSSATGMTSITLIEVVV